MRIALYLSLLLLLFACGKPKPEFKALDNGVQLKLLTFGETEKPFDDNYFVRASIQLISNKETVYQQDEYAILTLDKSPFEDLMEELSEGDSAYFKMPLAYLKSIPFNINIEGATDTLNGYIKIHEYLTEEQKTTYLTQNDPELLEQLSLKKYLANFKGARNKGGVTIKTVQKGNGEAVEIGKTLLLKYKASFINGIEFDNTHYQRYFEYNYGTPNQVIAGLEIALSEMKNKEKAKIIIPSQLAFGDEGSSTGIVPPFTTVVYDLEIIDIK
jgi:FKBP-type peptidyl-prolyl cis-trans isomerase